jgi:NAD(P)-dependent dehydrogenase (short-subunit alcohol dehydrogenase family)
VTGFQEECGPQDPENASLSSWRQVHAVNSDGVFLGCKYAIQTMKQFDDGAIVNISSRSGLVGIPGAAAYAASKAALSVAAQSYSLRVPAAQAIFTIEPTAIEKSKMFGEMSPETQNKHRSRAQGELLQISQVNSKIIELLTDSKQLSGNFFLSNDLPI